MLALITALVMASGLLFNAYDGTIGQTVSCILYCGLAISLVLAQPASPAFWRRIGPVLLLALAGLAWAVIATYREPYGLPDYTPGRIVAYIGALGALLAGTLLAWRMRSRARIIDLLMSANTVFVVLGLAMFWTGADSLFPFWTTERLGRFQGTIGNVNVTSVVAACFALWAGHRLLALLRHHFPVNAREVLRHALYGSAFAVNLLAVVLTASRFTNVLLVFGLAVCGVLFCVHRRMPVHFWATRMVLPAIPVGIGAWYFSGRLVERFDALSDGWRLRVSMWTHYGALATDRLMFGYGIGSFTTVNTQYLTDPHSASATWAVNSPHDLLLQLLLGGGLPYCLLVLAAATVAAVRIFRSLKGRWTEEDIAILAMIALIVASAMIDVVLDMPATVGLTMFFAGLLLGHVPERVEASVAPPRKDPAFHEEAIRH